MAEKRDSSIPVRRTLSKRGDTLRQVMKGQGQDPDGDDDDRMEVASPRAGHRRSLPGRERGASLSSSSKSSFQRVRGGAPAGELLDLNHER
eukprot:11344050-Prorocentrum_lima.AAC.1